ncbi:hypothetical protein ACS0TY_004992 [Phlomoides rotata]
MVETKLRIKLLIDTVGKRVMFVEAGKDCVDFLFFILSLPLSTLIRLLGKQQMVGSLGNLYQSFEALDESYIQPNITKDILLKPGDLFYQECIGQDMSKDPTRRQRRRNQVTNLSSRPDLQNELSSFGSRFEEQIRFTHKSSSKRTKTGVAI